MFNFHLLIIKPDGDYFLSGGHITDKQVGKLLKKADWSKYKNDWKLSFQREVINGYDLLKDKPSRQFVSHIVFKKLPQIFRQELMRQTS